MGIPSEFREFLMEYKVVPLAVAFIIGVAATSLIQSLVANIIMPILTPFIPGGDWQNATFSIGAAKIGWGVFLAAAINFAILALVVFAIAKYILHEQKDKQKAGKK